MQDSSQGFETDHEREIGFEPLRRPEIEAWTEILFQHENMVGMDS